MNKKAIAILGGIFLLIVITLGVIIYLRSRQSSEPVVIDEPEIIQEPVIDFPDFEEPEFSGSSGAVRLTDESVVTPALFFQGNGIAYFDRQGRLYRTDMSITDGTVLLSNKTELQISPRSNLSKILWPQVGSSFIAESGIGLARQWAYYNPETGAYVDLPRQVKSVSWMPDGNKIIYVWVDDSNKATLSIANPDTSGYQVLTDLYDNDIEVSVSSDGQTIAFYRTQTADQSSNGLFTVSSDGQRWGDITRQGYNRGAMWSPDSRKILFSRLNPSNQKYQLWWADVSTGATQYLGVETSETKAVWTRDGNSIVVAVPSPTSGVGTFSSDTIYRINVTTGERTEFSPGTNVDAQELFLSLDEQVVFFRNAQDGALYYMFLR